MPVAVVAAVAVASEPPVVVAFVLAVVPAAVPGVPFAWRLPALAAAVVGLPVADAPSLLVAAVLEAGPAVVAAVGAAEAAVVPQPRARKVRQKVRN